MSFIDTLKTWLPAGNGGNTNWKRIAATVGAILAFIVLFLFVLARPSHADDSIAAHMGAETVHGTGIDIGIEYYHDLGGGKFKIDPPQLFCGTDMMGADGLGDPNNWAWYCGLRGSRGYLHVGIGAAYLQRIDSLNGAHTNYTLQLEYDRWKWCHIKIIHFSDAGTTPVNTGRNLLVCEYQLR